MDGTILHVPYGLQTVDGIDKSDSFLDGEKIDGRRIDVGQSPVLVEDGDAHRFSSRIVGPGIDDVMIYLAVAPADEIALVIAAGDRGYAGRDLDVGVKIGGCRVDFRRLEGYHEFLAFPERILASGLEIAFARVEDVIDVHRIQIIGDDFRYITFAEATQIDGHSGFQKGYRISVRIHIDIVGIGIEGSRIDR